MKKLIIASLIPIIMMADSSNGWTPLHHAIYKTNMVSQHCIKKHTEGTVICSNI